MYMYIYVYIEFATEIRAGVAERALAAEGLENAPLQLLGRLQRGVRAHGEGVVNASTAVNSSIVVYRMVVHSTVVVYNYSVRPYTLVA